MLAYSAISKGEGSCWNKQETCLILKFKTIELGIAGLEAFEVTLVTRSVLVKSLYVCKRWLNLVQLADSCIMSISALIINLVMPESGIIDLAKSMFNKHGSSILMLVCSS
eukprot:NODE_767_length_4389_cov_0.039860.p3 type:complete len:110 gc:universal NODE_767_length_4389_cov_0.039860:3722-3393(-)